MALTNYINDPRYAKLAQSLPANHLRSVQGMLDSGMNLDDALSVYGMNNSAERTTEKLGVADKLASIGQDNNTDPSTVVGNVASLAGTGMAIGGPVGAAIGGVVGIGAAIFGNAKKRREEEEQKKELMKTVNSAELAQQAAEKNTFAKGGENEKEGDGKKERSGLITGFSGTDNNLVNLNKGDYVINSAALYADYLAKKPHAVKLVNELSKKGILTKTASGIKMSEPNAKVSAGEILLTKKDLGDNKAFVEGLSVQSGTSKRQSKTPKAGEQNLAKLATAAGAAQTIAGLVQSNNIGDIKDLEVSSDVRRATDMILKASEQGIDPSLMAREERNIEARRRSTLYGIEGSSQTAGTRFNQKVATNIASNRAGQDLMISADDRLYDKTKTAASALLTAGEHKMNVKLQNQNLQMRKAESAADLIGAGIDNITGSYMLREQMKAEKERSKYN
jgi:hypothetical protein